MDLVEEIKTAIREEIRAQKKYAQLAEHAIDPLLKDFFLQLQKEEENHERLLISRYEAIMKLLGRG